VANFSTPDAFPRPVHFSRKVSVGSSPTWLKVFLAIGALLFVALTIFLATQIRGNVGSWGLFGMAFGAVMLSLPLHEILHLVAHPKFGTTRTSRFGFGIIDRKPAIWVGYADWVSRTRAVFVLTLPFFVLALVFPVTALLVDPRAGVLFASIGAANVLSSHSDLKVALAIKLSSATSVFEADSGFYEK